MPWKVAAPQDATHLLSGVKLETPTCHFVEQTISVESLTAQRQMQMGQYRVIFPTVITSSAKQLFDTIVQEPNEELQFEQASR